MKGMGTVTVVLTVKNKEDRAHVCRLAPRVQDAIVSHFFRHPISGAASSEAGTGNGEFELLQNVSAAVGDVHVTGVSVIEGRNDRAEGRRSRFAGTLGCQYL